jgi:hypothetical protein
LCRGIDAVAPAQKPDAVLNPNVERAETSRAAFDRHERQLERRAHPRRNDRFAGGRREPQQRNGSFEDAEAHGERGAIFDLVHCSRGTTQRQARQLTARDAKRARGGPEDGVDDEERRRRDATDRDRVDERRHDAREREQHRQAE